MYHCKDCGQDFDETLVETIYIENMFGDVDDYVNTCPFCGGSMLVKKENKNDRD